MAQYGIRAVLILVLIQGFSLVAVKSATHASETSLRAALASGYDQNTRPDTPTYIDIAYNIRSLNELNVASQQLIHSALLVIMWHDPRLEWNSTAYSNIAELDINWTWRPMFVLGNSADNMDLIGGDNSLVKASVFSNGSVVWFQTMIATTICDVDISTFPYDDQSCDVFLSFIGNDLGGNFGFNLSTTEVSTMIYLLNAEWLLTGSSLGIAASTTCCPQTTMPFLKVTFNFDRLHTFYLNTFLLPTILLSICLVWPFYLPTESGERIGFALTIFLSYTVVLSMTAEFLPTTSRQTPTLATYLLAVLFLCTIAVCNVTLHVKLYYLTTDPPAYVKAIYRKVKPVVFMECCKKKSTKVTSTNAVVSVEDLEKPPLKGDTKEKPDKDPDDEEEDIVWAEISVLMDRICFIVYLTGVVILNIVLMVYLAAS